MSSCSRWASDSAWRLDVIVFTGLSLEYEEARQLSSADVRPPVKSGDLDNVRPGRTVAIIDGELECRGMLLSEEIQRALARGIQVHGAASVGAWRAAELVGAGMRRAGWVYEAYRSGRISGTDEIAMMYDPRTLAPITIPLVSIRYELESLASRGIIPWATAQDAIASARAVPLVDRGPGTLAARLGAIIGPDYLGATLQPVIGRGQDIKAADARQLLRALNLTYLDPRAY